MTRALALVVLWGLGCNGPATGSVAQAEPTPAAAPAPAAADDPLPSWNDGPTKHGITDFVERVTREHGPDFVPIERRIAVFDNDGTLWVEQPFPVELAFAFDRIKVLSPRFAVTDILGAAGEGSNSKRELMEILAQTHVGMTTVDFMHIVEQWIATARDSRFKRAYTELVYQPMLELLAYLHSRGFATYIVSGGEAEFMRSWSERVYGIPPEHVIGSRVALRYEERPDGPVLVRLPTVDLVTNKSGKPIGIQQLIGRRPIAAFGNSDGDFEMLEWTTSAPGLRLGLLVHHTDAAREWAYDRDSRVGKLSYALDESKQRGWLVADMKHDWKVIFPFELH